MKICAGIVTFNPDLERLEYNITSISSQCERVFIYDNASENKKNIQKLTQKFQNVLFVQGKTNTGIAFALNRLAEAGLKENYTWQLTLDQDSIAIPYLISTYSKYLHLKKVAMLSCYYNDVNIGHNDLEDKIKEIDICITSAALTNLHILQKVGFYDEKMFIDFVDFDICATFKEKGYKIYRIPFVGIEHEVGHSIKRKTIFGVKIIYNHSSFRKYYIFRNSIYYFKKHKRYFSFKRRIKFRFDLIRDFLLLFYENNRMVKIKAAIKGIYSGIGMAINEK